MGSTAVLALKVVLAMALAGSVLVQTVIVPLLWRDLDEVGAGVRVPVVVIVVGGVACLQVIAVCLWRLSTRARRGTVFSPAALVWVRAISAACFAGAALTFALAVVLAPGEDVAPGVVGLICGVSLVVAGVGLVVVVLRHLLEQAAMLQAELAEVI